MADIRDILDIERPPSPDITREAVLGAYDKARKKPGTGTRQSKRPEGMCREVFALLSNDAHDVTPLYPSEPPKGYKQPKANLGMKKVRPWKWMPFENPARADGAIFHHWRRVADEGKEYTFARFNKKVEVPTYTELEYVHVDGWTRNETQTLFDLCRRFDLRFGVVHDRWLKLVLEKDLETTRTIEELKERYYSFCAALSKARNETTKIYVFDADHEFRRKKQLERLFQRTQGQLDEEQMLLNELRKIDARKKEREKKTQDLQKLITAADSQVEARGNEKRIPKKRVQQTRPAKVDTAIVETTGIKFPDFKGFGPSLRSQRMKLPVSAGQKKAKAIEGFLNELGLDLNPIPSEQICQSFNELRSDMVLLYELRTALSNCMYELQSLRHQYEAQCPGKTLAIPSGLSQSSKEVDLVKGKAPSMEVIVDVVGSPGTPTIN